MDTVDLIASGYEWTCPICGRLVKEDCILESRIVVCPRCDSQFEIGIIDHAHE